MPNTALTVKPGIFSQLTEAAADLMWWISQLIRWDVTGMPQKLGGWQQLSPFLYYGIARGMHAWADLAAVDYVAVGTEQQLALFAGGALYDITPIRATTNPAVSFTTILGQVAVTITDAANGAAPGDWINVNVPVSVGGIVLQGPYQVQSVTNANSYVVNAATPATASATNAGAVPKFTSTNSSGVLKVTLNNHGLVTGSSFTVEVATTIATIVMAAYSTYAVTFVDANNFDITPGGTATSGTSVFENGGDAQIQYRIGSGLASSGTVSGTYGSGTFGSGVYGAGSGSAPAPLRLWFLDNWGQDLVGNYNGSTIYQWVPPIALGNDAIPLTGTDIPQTVNSSFVSTQQQIMVALGCDPPGGGTQDPLSVRWCDVGDNTDWLASATNQAGSYRIPTGSRLVGGINGPSFNMLWTDIDVWLMGYQGYPLVYSFNRIAGASGMIAPHAAGLYDTLILWAGPDNFHYFDGAVARPIECPVRDQFFGNINPQQTAKIWCWSNSLFREVWWFYPSLNGTGEVDSYVKVTITSDMGFLWDYGQLPRTCGIDENVFGAPLAADTSNLIQQHETSNDANGQAMMSYIQSGWMTLQDATYEAFLERVIADFVLTTTGAAGSAIVSYQILVTDYPTGSPVFAYGPYTCSPGGPPYSIVRARGKLFAIRISSATIGVFWRLGKLRHNAAPAGRR